jgi:radical SAM protein with 4Fe4S-binding SPASM domain
MAVRKKSGMAKKRASSEKQKHEAQAMADFIESWLKKPAVRKMLKFCTKRDSCGRRIEHALEMYIGQKPRVCMKCKLAAKMMGSIMGKFLEKSDGDKNTIKLYLQDPMWRKGLASVLEGIAEWGPAKPFTSYAPFLVVWNTTRNCNLKCRHCYAYAGTKDPNELTDKETIMAVDKMADAGVAFVALSGGEPLIRPNIYSIIDRIRERGMAFSIATNATLLTKEHAKKLMEKNCLFVQVSLDGAKPETHNNFRGKNAFELTCQGIRNAVAEGLHVGISCTVTQHNYREVRDIIDLAEKLGAKTFMHYNFIPTGRGTDIIDTDISPRQREDLLKMLIAESKKRKGLTLLSTACQFSRVCLENDAAMIAMTHFDNSMIGKNDQLAVLADVVGGCGTGRLYCALDYDGKITPCVFIPIELGNIRKDDFLKVWLNSDVLKKIRDREHFHGRCAKCSYRNVCGGCRARAYGYSGDIQASDVGCIRNEDEWNKLKASSKVKA